MSDKKMKILEFAALLTIWATLAFSCGTTKGALEDKVYGLEQETIRLKADRANLDARNASLDDSLVVLEKKLKRCRSGETPMLPVVKLNPGTTDEKPAVENPPDKNGRDATFSKSDKRPRLVLVGRANHPSISGQLGKPSNLGGLDSFEALGPDNLGVMPLKKDGAATHMDTFQAAYRDYTNKRYEEALFKFSKFVHDDANNDYADNGIFWRGECYLAMGKFLQAIGEFERLLRRYPRSEKTPSGLYRIGFAYDRLRDHGKALEYYFHVVEKYPRSDAARRASRRVSEIENKRGMIGDLMPTAAKR